MQNLLSALEASPRFSVPSNAVTELLSGVTNEMLGDYLGAITKDTNRVAEIARHSYKHQLGFEKFHLNPDQHNDALCLRLHYWMRNSGTPFDGEIHDHRHNFTSKVFIGSLSHTFYQTSAHGNELSLFEYRFDNATNISTQHYICSTGAKVISNKTINQGETYSLDNTLLHSVSLNEAIALSLLVQGPQIKSTATVLKSKEKAEQRFVGVGIGQLTIEQVAIRLSEIAKLLRGEK